MYLSLVQHRAACPERYTFQHAKAKPGHDRAHWHGYASMITNRPLLVTFTQMVDKT